MSFSLLSALSSCLSTFLNERCFTLCWQFPTHPFPNRYQHWILISIFPLLSCYLLLSRLPLFIISMISLPFLDSSRPGPVSEPLHIYPICPKSPSFEKPQNHFLSCLLICFHSLFFRWSSPPTFSFLILVLLAFTFLHYSYQLSSCPSTYLSNTKHVLFIYLCFISCRAFCLFSSLQPQHLYQSLNMC